MPLAVPFFCRCAVGALVVRQGCPAFTHPFHVDFVTVFRHGPRSVALRAPCGLRVDPASPWRDGHGMYPSGAHGALRVRVRTDGWMVLAPTLTVPYDVQARSNPQTSSGYCAPVPARTYA